MTTTRISEDLNTIQSHENVRAKKEGAISCVIAQGQVVPRGREQLFTEFDSNTCIYGADDRIAERDLDLGAVFGQAWACSSNKIFPDLPRNLLHHAG
jgi:hypothetical protein